MKIPYLNKFWYYFLNYTWGLPLTIAGWFVALALLITGHKPKRYGPCVVFTAGGDDWGGFSIGTIIVIDKEEWDHLNRLDDLEWHTNILDHEFGHSIQNALLGPLMPFLVSIPSTVRYWWVTLKTKKDGHVPDGFDYYSIWFERTASLWGEENYRVYWA